MAYLSELRVNWRYLAAASIGLGFGHMLSSYILSVFVPHLLLEFGWSASQFALIGITVVVAAIFLPVAGRLTDRYGVRRIGLVGVCAGPLLLLWYSRLGGSFAEFFLLCAVQSALVGATTTPTVYSRLIAERFRNARGAALAIAVCAPAAVGAVAVPLLSAFVDAHGWRRGFEVTALFVGVAGAAALLLIPRHREPLLGASTEATTTRVPADYPTILRSRPFQIIFGAMLLCNLPLYMQSTQLKLVLVDAGAAPASTAFMISLYAAGVVVGRLGCGIALDRLPAHLVAAVTLGLPAIGLFALGAGLAAPLALASAVFLIGFSMGAEGDVAAYLVMRHFRVEIYSTVYSMIAAAIAASAALGSVLLSAALRISDGDFSSFLFFTACTTLLGASLFLRLPSERFTAPEDDRIDEAQDRPRSFAG